jgi:multiple sugar transport system substrate-binding protein
MLIAAPPFAAQLAAQAPGLSYDVAPIPAGLQQATFGVTDSIVMFRASEAKEAAWDFLQLLFQPKWRAEFAEKEGLLPTTVAADGDAADPALAPFAALLPQARFTPTVRDWEVIADLTSNALQRIYLGEQSPREALTAAAEEIDGVLGR